MRASIDNGCPRGAITVQRGLRQPFGPSEGVRALSDEARRGSAVLYRRQAAQSSRASAAEVRLPQPRPDGGARISHLRRVAASHAIWRDRCHRLSFPHEYACALRTSGRDRESAPNYLLHFRIPQNEGLVADMHPQRPRRRPSTVDRLVHPLAEALLRRAAPRLRCGARNAHLRRA
ncbi:unnamed protein product, partial [Iphiclides podalirius]